MDIAKYYRHFYTYIVEISPRVICQFDHSFCGLKTVCLYSIVLEQANNAHYNLSI